MSKVTLSAARRRFERRHDSHQTISTLRPSEQQGMHGRYALMNGNTIVDAGDLAAVARWCRDAGVLHLHETVVA